VFSNTKCDICVCVRARVRVCARARARACMYVCMYVCMCMCVCMYVNVCVYIYIYIYTYVHTYNELFYYCNIMIMPRDFTWFIEIFVFVTSENKCMFHDMMAHALMLQI